MYNTALQMCTSRDTFRRHLKTHCELDTDVLPHIVEVRSFFL